ncbi:MAG: hypothetical protein NUV69_01340 [Candidatus Curtissbacteria bacterium]|nr:hypothetical protein [Candidatus Curtissbacteria bacterium]
MTREGLPNGSDLADDLDTLFRGGGKLEEFKQTASASENGESYPLDPFIDSFLDGQFHPLHSFMSIRDEVARLIEALPRWKEEKMAHLIKSGDTENAQRVGDISYSSIEERANRRRELQARRMGVIPDRSSREYENLRRTADFYDKVSEIARGAREESA